jgi:hypothetical protein
MAPVLPLEPLRNAVLALGGAVLLLAIFLLLERSLALLVRTRAARREPALTRAIYDALQSSPVRARPFPRLSRFDRKLVRSILLDLALDLRGETAEAIAHLYRQLGFLRRDLRRASGNSPSGGESGHSGSTCGEISPGVPWNVAA